MKYWSKIAVFFIFLAFGAPLVGVPVGIIAFGAPLVGVPVGILPYYLV